MISRKFFPPLFLFALLISSTAKSQTPTTNNVYLGYYVNTNSININKSPYFSAIIQTPFTVDDYEKVLKLSAQHVLNETKAHDSLVNYDWGFSFQPLFNSDKEIVSSANLTEADLKTDANLLGPYGSYYPTGSCYDCFRLKNGNAVALKVSVGSDFRFLTRVDSSSVMGKNGKQTLQIKKTYLSAENAAMSFIEKWSFDPLTGIFQKNVTGSGFFRLIVDPTNNEPVGYSPFIFLMNKNENYNPSTDVLLKKNVIVDQSIEENEEWIRGDSSWLNSKPEDIVNTLEYGLANIPDAQRTKFLSSVFYYAFHNPTKVFPVKNMVVDSLHPFQSSKQIQNLFCQWDSTNQIEDPENSGKFIYAPIKFSMQLGSIYAIRFYEDWYYDSKEMTIQKKVNGIGFIEIKRDMMNQPNFVDTGIYLKVN